jgi:hypothetical protein
VNVKSAKGAVAALQSANMSTRYLAWTALNQMQGKAEKELAKLWASGNPRMRARAVNLLARIKGSEQKYVDAAVADADYNIRITGLRLARSLKMDVIPYLRQLAKDSSTQVRRECAIALRHSGSPEAPGLWVALAQRHNGKDRWYLEALGIAMDKQEDKFFEAWLARVGDQWNSPAGRDIIWRSRSTKAPAWLARIITDKSTTTKEREHFMRSLDFIKGSEKDAALVEISTSLLN